MQAHTPCIPYMCACMIAHACLYGRICLLVRVFAIVWCGHLAPSYKSQLGLEPFSQWTFADLFQETENTIPTDARQKENFYSDTYEGTYFLMCHVPSGINLQSIKAL